MDMVNGKNISEYWHEINNEIIIIMIQYLFTINDFYICDFWNCFIGFSSIWHVWLLNYSIVDVKVNL